MPVDIIERLFLMDRIKKEAKMLLVAECAVFVASYLIILVIFKAHIKIPHLIALSIALIAGIIYFCSINYKKFKQVSIGKIRNELLENKISKHEELSKLLVSDIKLSIQKIGKVTRGEYVSQDAFVRQNLLIQKLYDDISNIEKQEDALMDIWNEIMSKK